MCPPHFRHFACPYCNEVWHLNVFFFRTDYLFIYLFIYSLFFHYISEVVHNNFNRPLEQLIENSVSQIVHFEMFRLLPLFNRTFRIGQERTGINIEILK